MQKKTLHHIIPTSRGGKEDRNSQNTIKLNLNIHQGLHTTFGNAFPNEQIIEIINNPENKIIISKKEDLYNLLGMNSYYKIYFPELITNIDSFYKKHLRTGQVINPKKIKQLQKNFFKKEKTTEEKILKMYEINKSVLKTEFKEKLLKIIN